ncbi:hypothetical protein IFU01_05670 [Oxalobacteraceae sp. CFBP 8763]|nr:hypothetical protein [Oxalobacteraceae sp. CFBP 8763]
MLQISRPAFFALVFIFLGTTKLSYGQTSAVVDCRAGCQGNFRGCQQSVAGQARLEATPGRKFDFSTLKITRRSNAADSPGLENDPDWKFETIPANVSKPTTIIIRPIVNTCIGKSLHTQGVTFFEWSADYVKEEETVSWIRKSSDSANNKPKSIGESIVVGLPISTRQGNRTGIEMPAKVVAASPSALNLTPQFALQSTLQRPAVFVPSKSVFICYSTNAGNVQGCQSHDVRLCNSDSQPHTAEWVSSRGLASSPGPVTRTSVPGGAGTTNGPKIGESVYMDGICREYRYTIVRID